MEADQFRLILKEILGQVNRLDSAKDYRGAIDELGRGIVVAEEFLRDHRELAAEFGSWMPDLYSLRASFRHKLSQVTGTKDKKDLLASARKDLAKALSFPDAYYPQGKARLKALEGMIK